MSRPQYIKCTPQPDGNVLCEPPLQFCGREYQLITPEAYKQLQLDGVLILLHQKYGEEL